MVIDGKLDDDDDGGDVLGSGLLVKYDGYLRLDTGIEGVVVDWISIQLLDMLVAKLKDSIWDLFLCIPRLDIDSGGLKRIENDADVHAFYDLVEKHVTKHAGNMSVKELVAWVEDEANSPYLWSPPLKSRPFRNDMKGKVLFTNMYCAEDEGFEHYPPLNDDEVGKNDVSKSSEFNQGVHGLVDCMSKGMNDGANIDIDEQILARQNKLDKGKCLMTSDDIVTSKKRKIASMGNVMTQTSLDYLSNGEDEVIKLKKRRIQCKSNGAKVPNEVPHELGEKFLNIDKFKKCLTFYALANGYSLFFERSNKDKMVAKCGQRKETIKDPSECKQRAFKKYPSNNAEKQCAIGGVICRNAKNFTLTKGDVTIQDHYGYLRYYAKALADLNEGNPDEKTYFDGFYVSFKGLKDGTQQSQVIRVGAMGTSIHPGKSQGTSTKEATRSHKGRFQKRATTSLGAMQTRVTTTVRGGTQTRATTYVRDGSQTRARTTPQFIPPRMKSQIILHNKVSNPVKGFGSSKDNEIVLE
ncbi:hypothetical protein Tco_0820088 [Tanacetum coccineum]|uniref:Uncharacterized protein n=1 Tax=Tanacetum coccineum TaxID=301880 RepID=A0ABQ5ACP5_9ASTR